MAAWTMRDFSDSQIVNYVVRMVVPMRREFGRQIDVQQFLHDGEYARSVLDEALTSKDARLLEYASYVSQRLLSARVAAAPPPPVANAPAGAPGVSGAPTAAPAASAPPAAVSQPEQALRTRVLDKYRRGLR
jgi:hypothetical protein